MAPGRPQTLIVLFLGSLLGLVGCQKPAAPVAVPVPAVESVGNPPTEEEALALAGEISNAIDAGDAAALDRLIDWTVVSDRCTAGVDAPANFRKGFIQGLDESRTTGKGVSSSIVDAIKKGGSYSLLHSHSREKTRRLLFRLLLPEAGVNYHDFVLARRPDGKVKAVDLYVFLTGEMVTQSFRRAYIQAAAQANGGIVDRLTGADQKFVKYFTKLQEMSEATRSGKFAEALDLYKGFPADLKKEKTVLMVRLQAAQGLGDDAEYTKSIEDFRTEYPNDACVDVMSIDYFLIKKQFDDALACVDRLDRAVLGDPYLLTIRASTLIEKGDLAAARAAAKQAIDADASLIDAYWVLTTLSLKEKNFDETLKTLRLIHDKFKIEIGDLATLPVYKEFSESPQYQEWLKEAQAAAAKSKGAGDDPK